MHPPFSGELQLQNSIFSKKVPLNYAPPPPGRRSDVPSIMQGQPFSGGGLYLFIYMYLYLSLSVYMYICQRISCFFPAVSNFFDVTMMTFLRLCKLDRELNFAKESIHQKIKL